MLFEKDSVASHASGFAFGVLLPPIIEDPQDPEADLNRVSFALHRELAESLPVKSGVDVELQRKTALVLALDAAEAVGLRGTYAAVKNSSRDIRWLSHGELSHIEPRIAPDIPGGLYLGDTYEVEPYKLTLALWQAAEKHGARLVNRAVDRVLVEHGRAIGVEAGGEKHFAGAVVVAAGPWSGALLDQSGVRVPVTPLKGQIIRLQVNGPPMRVSVWWRGDYASSKPDGLVWCGTTEEHEGFNEQPTPDARDGITLSALRALPYLETATLVKQTACLRPVTADGLPVLGVAPGVEHLTIATGAGRHGIAVGPGMGKAAALLAMGAAPSFDTSRLSPARFSG